jgi:uncharacterized protein (TIGR02246 family)
MRDEDTAAIRATVADAVKYQSDTEPFVALHTADAIIVNIAGRRVLGRDRIHEAMAKALDSPLAQVLTTVEVEDIRFVTPDVAIVSCTKYVSDERDTSLKASAVPGKGSLTYVMAKEDGAWRIAVAHTTPVVAP